MTYSELVKEAIRKAHEEAEANTPRLHNLRLAKPIIHIAFATMIVSFL